MISKNQKKIIIIIDLLYWKKIIVIIFVVNFSFLLKYFFCRAQPNIFFFFYFLIPKKNTLAVMSLSSSQQKRCLEVMDRLFERRTSQMFAQPVDPERDNCPNYFDVVKTPMDLGTVRKKLTSGQYKTVSEWKDDVKLIWSNSNAYNPKKSLLSYITKDLADFYHKLTVYLTDSPQNDWANELNFLSDEMNQIMKEMSDPSLDAIPIPTPNPLPPQQQQHQQQHQQHQQQTHERTKTERVKGERKSERTRSQKPQPVPQIQGNGQQGQTMSTRQKSKKSIIDPETGERIYFKEEKKHTRPLSKDMLHILSHDINMLEDENQINIILELLKVNEPDIKDNGGDIEVDLNTLRSSTLRLLREQVDTFMEDNYL